MRLIINSMPSATIEDLKALNGFDIVPIEPLTIKEITYTSIYKYGGDIYDRNSLYSLQNKKGFRTNGLIPSQLLKLGDIIFTGSPVNYGGYMEHKLP